MTVACSRRGSDTRKNFYEKTKWRGLLGKKKGVERLIILKFVFKNVVIVDGISMSLDRCHVTAMEARVTSEVRVFFLLLFSEGRLFCMQFLLHAVYSSCLK